jgi:oligopeptide transport system substrate-binding protein
MLKVGVVAFLLALSCACHSPSKPQKELLRINILDEPQALDPRKARDTTSLTIARMLFDGLTRVGKDEKVELAVAERVEVSEDLRTYTFHLRDARWTNGDLVTAFDFVYAWKKVLDPLFAAENASQLYVIKNGKKAKAGEVDLDELGVRAVDAHTLQVELENPTPYFLELLAFPTFFPVNQRVDQENPAWAMGVESYVCNGPFVLSEWRHQDHIEVKKNKTYWDVSSVRLLSILLVMVKGETELKMFEKRELDWAGSPLSVLPVDALKELKKRDALQTKSVLGTYFLRCNTQSNPFSHVEFRKAFALAIRRQAIVEHVTQGNQIPATGLVPLSMGLQKGPYFQDGDLSSAKALFAQGLQKMEKELPSITLLYRAEERNHLIAQAIQQQWFDAFGIRVKLEAVESKVYFDRLFKQDYQLASGSWFADFNDPINFLEIFKYRHQGVNNTLWENKTYTQLLDASSKEPDRAKRMELLSCSEKVLMEEMPIIPIFYSAMLYVKEDDVQDVVLSSMGNLDFKWAHIK